MPTIEDYCSGRILVLIRRAHIALRIGQLPLVGSWTKRTLQERVAPLGIHPVTLDEAGDIIRCCRCCAAGPRVCQPLFPGSSESESIFLDELASGMIGVRKAVPVTKDQAMTILRKYPDKPLVLSPVSGKCLEICRSEPRVCIYWKMRRNGIKC